MNDNSEISQDQLKMNESLERLTQISQSTQLDPHKRHLIARYVETIGPWYTKMAATGMTAIDKQHVSQMESVIKQGDSMLDRVLQLHEAGVDAAIARESRYQQLASGASNHVDVDDIRRCIEQEAARMANTRDVNAEMDSLIFTFFETFTNVQETDALSRTAQETASSRKKRRLDDESDHDVVDEQGHVEQGHVEQGHVEQGKV